MLLVLLHAMVSLLQGLAEHAIRSQMGPLPPPGNAQNVTLTTHATILPTILPSRQRRHSGNYANRTLHALLVRHQFPCFIQPQQRMQHTICHHTDWLRGQSALLLKQTLRLRRHWYVWGHWYVCHTTMITHDMQSL